MVEPQHLHLGDTYLSQLFLPIGRSRNVLGNLELNTGIDESSHLHVNLARKQGLINVAFFELCVL